MFKTKDGHRINQKETYYYVRGCNVEAVRIIETVAYSNNTGVKNVRYNAETIEPSPDYKNIYTICEASSLYKSFPLAVAEGIDALLKTQAGDNK